MNTNYPHITKDANGNVVHYKDINGYEYCQEFDEKNNLIHYKNSGDYESWREYDANNNQIHYKHSSGKEYWYDTDGNKIPNPALIKELTLDEIALKFNIDVKNLKIKK